MRSLSIKREKTFVGCAGKMKVYISDPTSPEIMISGVPCRQLGVLKNGEEKQFTIDEKEAELFVIADKLSKEFSSDSVTIPAGEEDISLCGKNHFNPFLGNPFRFDGVVPNERALKNRKKAPVIGLAVLLGAVLVGLAAGWAVGKLMIPVNKPEAKLFVEEGMQITLTDQFDRVNMDGFTVCFDSPNAAVFALQEKFALLPGSQDYTLEEYGELVLQNNNMDPSIKLKTNDGLTYFEYTFENRDLDKTFHYFCVLKKASDAFWMINFTVDEQNFETYRPAVIQWAKSITFVQSV